MKVDAALRGADTGRAYGYSPGIRQALGLADNERVAGFVYIGTPKEKPEERERPKLADIVAPWHPWPEGL